MAAAHMRGGTAAHAGVRGGSAATRVRGSATTTCGGAAPRRRRLALVHSLVAAAAHCALVVAAKPFRSCVGLPGGWLPISSPEPAFTTACNPIMQTATFLNCTENFRWALGGGEAEGLTCDYRLRTDDDLRRAFANRSVTFIGDSTVLQPSSYLASRRAR